MYDVYGVTKDLKVYYCDGEGNNTYGKAESYGIDPNEQSFALNNNPNAKNALASALGMNVNDVRLSDIVGEQSLRLDGTEINDLSAFVDMRSVRTLNLSNMTLTSLDGIEKMYYLNYIYIKNCNISNYKKLEKVTELTRLYIYMPSQTEGGNASLNDTVDKANGQVINLGEGLKNASGLKNLRYFGISGDKKIFEENLSYWQKILIEPSNKISNISSLGSWSANTSSCTGLAAFNSVIKNNLQYVYLNNNNFNSIKALKGFNGMVELDIMGNSSLNNFEGLEDLTSLGYLCSQKTGITSNIGLSGCSGLRYITLQDSSNLTDLSGFTGCVQLDEIYLYSCANLVELDGLENCINLRLLDVNNCSQITRLGNKATEKGIAGCTNIEKIVANNCNLTDISYLANVSYDGSGKVSSIGITHKRLSYLDLANNVNLRNVDVLGGLVGLNYIYLDGNLNMDYDSDSSDGHIQDIYLGVGSLNKTFEKTITDNGVESLKTVTIISQCINGISNIPAKYKSLFSSTSPVLDYSYSATNPKVGIGKLLTNDSNEWKALKDRTDVIKLNLSGQTALTDTDVTSGSEKTYGITSTLKTLTSMKALSLVGMTQLDNLNFIAEQTAGIGTADISDDVWKCNMPNLVEIDLRTTNSNLTNLNQLNYCINLRRLLVDNSRTNFGSIAEAMNRFSMTDCQEGQSWFGTHR